MKNWSSSVWLVSGAIILLLILLGQFFYRYQRVEKNVDKPNPEYYIDRFLVAKAFLKSRNQKLELTHSIKRFETPLSTNHVIFVNAPLASLGDTLSGQLADFVESGGTLLICPKWSFLEKGGYDHWILDDLDHRWVKRETHDNNKKDGKQKGDGSIQNLMNHFEKNAEYQSSLHYRGQSMDVSVNEDYWFEDNAGVFSAFVQYDWGAGELLIINDPGIWLNSEIIKSDNAYLLDQMMKDKETLFIIWQPKAQSFLELLWESYQWSIIFSGLFLLVFLQAKSVRVGRILSDEPPARRSFLEHMRASMRLLWVKKQGSILLDELVEDLIDQVTCHYGLQRLDRQQKLVWIAKKYQLSSDMMTVWQAKNIKRKDFIQSVRTIANIRNQL